MALLKNASRLLILGRASGRAENIRPLMSSQLSLSDQRDSMSLTLDELENHLYGCADKIRNTVDKTDYKDLILPLVFYKTINDTYQDELEKWTEELGDEGLARDPDLNYFVVLEVFKN